MTNIQLSSRTDQWFTPPWVMDLVHEAIPVIDLDPASCQMANVNVKAKRFFTAEDDALSQVWSKVPVTVFLNPPGGKTGNKSNVALFWRKLMEFRANGLLEEAIFMGFSLENMQVTQSDGGLSICDFPLVVPKKRIKFVSPEGTYNAPTHSNVIVYIPGISNNTSRFKAVFGSIGAIMHPG